MYQVANYTLQLGSPQNCGEVCSYRALEQFQNSSSAAALLTNFLSKETIHLHDFFIQQLLSKNCVLLTYSYAGVKYNKILTALMLQFVCMKDTALGKSLVINIALSFGLCYSYLPLGSHLELYISYKLVAVLQVCNTYIYSYLCIVQCLMQPAIATCVLKIQ